MANQITINKVTKAAKEGTIKAYVNFNVNGIDINGAMVKEGSKGVFVSMPQGNPYTDKDGKKRYPNIVYFTDEKLRDEVEAAILEAFAAAE